MLKRVLLILMIIVSISIVYGICNPPVGDWVISTGQEVCEGQNVVVNGDLTINGTGALFLNNSNFTLNSSSDREFNILVNDTGKFEGNNSELYRIANTFDISLYNNSLINFSNSRFPNGSILMMQESSQSYLRNSNFSDDLRARGSSINYWRSIYLGPLEETGQVTVVELRDNSVTNIYDSEFDGRIYFGFGTTGNSVINVYNTSFDNMTDFRANSTTNFKTASVINYTYFYGNTPTITGNITFLTSAPLNNFQPTRLLRQYPTFVLDQLNASVAGAIVNVTNSTGDVLFSGVTDANGFVLVNMTYSFALCGLDASNCDDDFNIATNSSEVLGLQTNTPITLYTTVEYPGPVPEFSTYALLAALVLVVGGFFVMRKYN